METVLLYLLGILIVVVGLALSVGLHELGHFLPAKLFGVRVSQFMIGFGPTVWSRKRGETEYGVKAIPLGGYVSMSGMYPPLAPGKGAREASTGLFQTLVQDARTLSAETIPEGEDHRAFYRLPVWKRIVVMLGGPAMNILLGIVFYAILLMGFGIPTVSTTIDAVDECLISASADRDECTSADPAAPAAEAGILPGDVVVEVSGVAIDDWSQIGGLVRPNAGDEVPITVLRDGEELDLVIVPVATERYLYDESGEIVVDAQGVRQTETVGLLGITALTVREPQSALAVLPAVGDNIVAVTNIITHLPQRLVDIAVAAFGDQERDPNGPISVVGVGRIAGEVVSSDAFTWTERGATVIGILAAVNIALAIFNLIPLLPLDGGHIAAALWEKIRRMLARLFRRPDPGPVDAAKLMPLTLAVVVVFGAMTLLLIYADIVKPVNLFG